MDGSSSLNDAGPPADESDENIAVKGEENSEIDTALQEYQVIKEKCEEKEDINPFLQWLHLKIPIPPTTVIDMKLLDDSVKFFLQSVYFYIKLFI